MNHFKVLILTLSSLLLFANCNKEVESWTLCYDCTLSQWVGEYRGEGDYFSMSGGSEFDIPVTITITSVSENGLTVNVEAENRILTSFTSTKQDLTPYFDIPSSDKSVNLILSYKGKEYKLSGTVKLYYKGNPDNVEKSISFDTFR